MNKKIILLGLVASGSLAFLTGCQPLGGNKKSMDELTIATVATPVEIEIINTFIKGYKSIPGNEEKKIKVIKINEDYDSWVNTKLYVNQMSDIIQVYDYSSEYWTANKLLQPISGLMAEDGIKESDYYDSIVEMCKSGSDGQMYWAPRDYNKVVCIYNKKMFDAADVEYPKDNWTYTDFINTCKALKDNDANISDYSETAVFYPADMNLNWAATYYPMVKSYGGELIDKENATAFKNPDAVKKAFWQLLDAADDEYTIDPTQEGAAFANKQAAMMFVSRPNVPNYVKSLGKDAIDFVSMPSFDEKVTEQSYVGMGCTGYGITADCPEEKKVFAWDFLKYVISEQGQNNFCKMGSGIPVLKALASDPNAEFRKYLPNANNDAFVSQPERDLPMTYMKGFKPNKQLGIYAYINSNFLSSFAKGNREEFFVTAKTRLEEIWNRK